MNFTNVGNGFRPWKARSLLGNLLPNGASVIVAYTLRDGDGVTRILAQVAERFVTAARGRISIVIIPQDCQKGSIPQALNGNNHPLVLFGHGQNPANQPNGFCGQDGNLALDVSHHLELTKRVVIGISCFSIEFLTECYQGANGTALGFRGKLNIPLTPPRPSRQGLDLKEWSRRIERCLQWSQRMFDCLLEGMNALLKRHPLSYVAGVLKGEFHLAARDLQREYDRLPDALTQEAFDLLAFKAAFESNKNNVVLVGDTNWSL